MLLSKSKGLWLKQCSTLIILKLVPANWLLHFKTSLGSTMNIPLSAEIVHFLGSLESDLQRGGDPKYKNDDKVTKSNDSVL